MLPKGQDLFSILCLFLFGGMFYQVNFRLFPLMAICSRSIFCAQPVFLAFFWQATTPLTALEARGFLWHYRILFCTCSTRRLHTLLYAAPLGLSFQPARRDGQLSCLSTLLRTSCTTPLPSSPPPNARRPRGSRKRTSLAALPVFKKLCGSFLDVSVHVTIEFVVDLLRRLFRQQRHHDNRQRAEHERRQ